jgi:hypothetical protein
MPAAGNLAVTVEGVEANGQPFKVILRHIYDGQPHPVIGSPDYDSNTYPLALALTAAASARKG